MTTLHDTYPCYDFAQHKGYVTAAHAEALAVHGPCPEHRMSYANVAAAAVVPRSRAEALVPVAVSHNGHVEDEV